MNGRDLVLGRIRRALGPAPRNAPEITRTYRQTGASPEPARLDLFEERLLEYGARVRRCAAADVQRSVSSVLADRGASRVVVPAGLDLEVDAGIDLVVDDGQLSAAELDAVDGVVTLAAVAIAETGTVVLDGSAGQGRRAITLVPDYHLCIVHAGQVVETVPEAVSRLRPERPLTWISGPSATSDIELSRVEGVHGPRTLEVLLVE